MTCRSGLVRRAIRRSRRLGLPPAAASPRYRPRSSSRPSCESQFELAHRPALLAIDQDGGDLLRAHRRIPRSIAAARPGSETRRGPSASAHIPDRRCRRRRARFRMPWSTSARSRTARMFLARPSFFWNSPKRRRPNSASRMISSDHQSPIASSDRAIGQASPFEARPFHHRRPLAFAIFDADHGLVWLHYKTRCPRWQS